MPFSTNAKQNLKDVNAMSDHNAQAVENLNLVSQNVQGPYAIKKSQPKSKGPLYLFDLPNRRDGQDPAKLAKLTGMSEEDCSTFIQANNERNQEAVTDILIKYKLGEPLGQGGFRLSIETDASYEERMRKQVDLLKNVIEGGLIFYVFRSSLIPVLMSIEIKYLVKLWMRQGMSVLPIKINEM